MPFLEVEDLHKHFTVRGAEAGTAVLRAVDGVSFSLERGKTLGVAGESGCGKSTLGRLILRLLDPTRGSVKVDGCDLATLGRRELREMRRRLQVVLQDPYGSLNPRMRVGQIVGEGIDINRIARGAARRRRIGDLLERVGLSPDAYDRFPHEFSGGQRQRIGIARALAVEPEMIVADEAVSALDVSVQAQIVNLLKDLQRERGIAIIFIAHDLRVIEHVSDRVAIMYLGRFVEIGTRQAVYGSPRHPYTRALLSAIPSFDPSARVERIRLLGDVPSATDPPAGCAFHPRCPHAEPICRRETPELLGASQHQVACPVFPTTDPPEPEP